MTEAQTRWIRTDASSDLLNSLEHCLLCFTLVRSDDRNWKWCVGAAHSAAQIAMAMVLMNAQRDEHLDRQSREDLCAYYEESRTNPAAEWPTTWLAKFLALYRACRKRLPKEVATPAQRKDIRRLNTLRNHRTHFGQEDLLVTPRLARIAVRAGIQLVVDLSPTTTSGLYRNRTDEARHEVAISSLLRLLDAVEVDEVTPSDEDDEAKYAALEAQLAAYGDDEDEAD